MKRTVLSSGALASMLFAAALAGGEPSRSVSPRVGQVEAFLAAFNAQDADAMAALATADVEWLSIDGAQMSIETGSREALRTAMRSYFASCPSCRARHEGAVATGDRVAVVEVAQWRARDGAKSQRGVAVYEFRGALVRRVHYFPSEP